MIEGIFIIGVSLVVLIFLIVMLIVQRKNWMGFTKTPMVQSNDLEEDAKETTVRRSETADEPDANVESRSGTATRDTTN